MQVVFQRDVELNLTNESARLLTGRWLLTMNQRKSLEIQIKLIFSARTKRPPIVGQAGEQVFFRQLRINLQKFDFANKTGTPKRGHQLFVVLGQSVAETNLPIAVLSFLISPFGLKITKFMAAKESSPLISTIRRGSKALAKCTQNNVM